VIGFTDSMVRLFSNNLTPLALARNIGLVAADLLPPVKRLITRQAMGLTGKLPRLGRGLKLR
jgi:2-octaprenyl-6-methoxyphenol hydroxylase